MKKLNTYVNIANFFAAIVSLVSGIVIWKILPSGQGFRGGRGEADASLFLGLARHGWIDIHTVSSLVFVGLAIVHLILHWYWIKNLPKMIKE